MISSQGKTRLRLLCALLLLVAQCANSAFAELTSGDKLPGALKDIKVADGVCRREDVSFRPDTSGAGLSPKPDLGCAISAGEVRGLLNDPNTALIDLRAVAEYQAFHIENSLSLDLPALQSKPYWRGKALILIGRGKLDQEIYTSCARLRLTGYKQVRVLHGGMLSWLAQNQEVIGRPASPQQMARLMDSEFWQESRGAHTLLVLSKEYSALQTELPLSIVLPQTNAETLKTIVDRWRKTTKRPGLISVILVANPAISDEQIRNLQQAVLPETLLVYTEGRAAYKRQMEIQKAIWSAQARGPKQLRCGQ